VGSPKALTPLLKPSTPVRRATAGKNLEQQPVAHGCGHGGRRRKGNCGWGRASAEEHAENACDDCAEQSAYE
jgi:hypothetical protein